MPTPRCDASTRRRTLLAGLLGLALVPAATAAPLDYRAAPGTEPAVDAELEILLQALDGDGLVTDSAFLSLSAPLSGWTLTLDTGPPVEPLGLAVDLGGGDETNHVVGDLSVAIAVQALSLETRGFVSGDPFLVEGEESHFFDSATGLEPSLRLTVNGVPVEIFGDTEMWAYATLQGDGSLVVSRMGVATYDNGSADFVDGAGQRWRIANGPGIGGGRFEDASVPFVPVPEPSTGALLALGIALLARRRRPA